VRAQTLPLRTNADATPGASAVLSLRTRIVTVAAESLAPADDA